MRWLFLLLLYYPVSAQGLTDYVRLSRCGWSGKPESYVVPGLSGLWRAPLESANLRPDGTFDWGVVAGGPCGNEGQFHFSGRWWTGCRGVLVLHTRQFKRRMKYRFERGCLLLGGEPRNEMRPGKPRAVGQEIAQTPISDPGQPFIDGGEWVRGDEKDRAEPLRLRFAVDGSLTVAFADGRKAAGEWWAEEQPRDTYCCFRLEGSSWRTGWLHKGQLQVDNWTFAPSAPQ